MSEPATAAELALQLGGLRTDITAQLAQLAALVEGLTIAVTTLTMLIAGGEGDGPSPFTVVAAAAADEGESS